MRKKMLLLGFAVAAVIGSLSIPRAHASGTHACPICTTYANCTTCCVSCTCDDDTGQLVSCTDHFCPPPNGPCEK
ncbi:MAG TPA: hypothetical protein VF173_30550 [Thermoanaerobaculia bacterium]|nr:hypothetical protein [Thermoanaerobaculia bacterium]